jgi:hypothetical protein
MLYKEESEALKKSHWPRCDLLADELASRGEPAADALENAAKSRVHHVRSASLRALAKVSRERAKALASLLLEDGAFEVRITAMQVLGITPPREVKRGYRLRR